MSYVFDGTLALRIENIFKTGHEWLLSKKYNTMAVLSADSRKKQNSKPINIITPHLVLSFSKHEIRDKINRYSG